MDQETVKKKESSMRHVKIPKMLEELRGMHIVVAALHAIKHGLNIGDAAKRVGLTSKTFQSALRDACKDLDITEIRVTSKWNRKTKHKVQGAVRQVKPKGKRGFTADVPVEMLRAIGASQGSELVWTHDPGSNMIKCETVR
jgi:hypothetical protein